MESYLSRNFRFGPLTRKSYASPGLGTTNLPLEQVPKNIARLRRPSPEKRDSRNVAFRLPEYWSKGPGRPRTHPAGRGRARAVLEAGKNGDAILLGILAAQPGDAGGDFTACASVIWKLICVYFGLPIGSLELPFFIGGAVACRRTFTTSTTWS